MAGFFVFWNNPDFRVYLNWMNDYLANLPFSDDFLFCNVNYDRQRAINAWMFWNN